MWVPKPWVSEGLIYLSGWYVESAQNVCAQLFSLLEGGVPLSESSFPLCFKGRPCICRQCKHVQNIHGYFLISFETDAFRMTMTQVISIGLFPLIVCVSIEF